MDEFSFIAKYLKPLAANFPGSLNLSDDAAVFSPPPSCELVITKDAICEGIHFIGLESPELIAGKALRVNLSDLAAMGATPLCYFLALMLPRGTSEDWLEKFALGLAQTQKEFSIALAGGDTTATDGKLAISITAIGTVPTGQALKRSGAKPGDDIYVSGTLGDSALGLELLLSSRTNVRDLCLHKIHMGDFVPLKDSSLNARNDNEQFLINRYLIPQPRIELGIKLHGIATSCMDISDGLAQDLGHICNASNVGAEIYAGKIPTSDTALSPRRMAGSGPRDKHGVTTILAGGDDYELLFTAPTDKSPQIENLAKSLQLPLTNIGKITAGNGVKILDESGSEMMLDNKGYRHF